MKNLKLTKGLSRNEMREIKGGKAATNTCGSRCNSEWGCGQDCPSCDAKWGDSYCS